MQQTKFPVSKEQFERIVQRWIDYAFTHSTEKAYGLDNDCAHERFVYSETEHERLQYCLELLEVLYDYGVKHGLVDAEQPDAVYVGAGTKAEW